MSGKIFATLWDEQHMNVMLDPPGILTAVQRMPTACAERWWGKRLAAVTVTLARIAPDELSELLGDAWERKAGRPAEDAEWGPGPR